MKMKFIEQTDGSYVSDKPIDSEILESYSNETDWDGDVLISTSENVEIVYNEKRLWKENTKHLGRNDRCICNSGKKFKKCCLNKEVA